MPISFVWHYTEDARLKGEHVYQDWGSVEYQKADPDDLISGAEARRRLAPLLENEPV